MLDKNFENDENEINHNLKELTREMHKQGSRTRIFINGIVHGLGRTIGATIVFALLITILSYVIDISDSTWIIDILSRLGFNQYLNT